MIWNHRKRHRPIPVRPIERLESRSLLSADFAVPVGDLQIDPISGHAHHESVVSSTLSGDGDVHTAHQQGDLPGADAPQNASSPNLRLITGYVRDGLSNPSSLLPKVFPRLVFCKPAH